MSVGPSGVVPERKINIAVAASATILAVIGAGLSLVFWVLGIGVDDGFHKAMGIGFVAINLGCWVALTRCLRAGRNGLALALSAAPAPLSVGLVFVAVYGCKFLGGQC